MHLTARSIAVGLFLSSLILGTLVVFAFPTAVTDFLSNVTGIKESAIKAVVDPATGKIPLRLLPQGDGSGLDADLLDGQHGSAYATAKELGILSDELASLATKVENLPAGGTDEVAGVSKLNGLTGSLTIAAGTGLSLSTSGSVLTLSTAGIPYSSLNLVGSITNADVSSTAAIAYSKLALGNSILGSDIFDGTITGADLSATAGIPYGALNLVGSLTNADIASSAAVAYSKLALAGQLVGSDLASGISISTSGSIATTSTGTITSSGLLTASNGLTLSAGALALPATSIADSYLSANVALLAGTQTFSGAKTFSQALSAPTTTDTINGLIVNAGALSGITTLSASGGVTLATLTSSAGSLTSTVADGASAIGFLFQTSTTYATAGAKLISIMNSSTEELALDKDGNLTLNGNLVATGTIQGTQLISTVSTGTPPLVVSSTTQVANLNASLLGGFTAAQLTGNLYNYLTNPGFEIWQRGVGGFTADLAYTADRWRIRLGASSTLTVTREGTTIQADSLYSLKGVYTHSAESEIRQAVMDGVAPQMRTRTVTFSAKVHANAANAVRLGIWTTATGWTYSSYHTGGGAWETLSVTATASAGANEVDASVILDATVTFYVDNATLVLGSTAQTYYPLHPAEDMERAQRYYEIPIYFESPIGFGTKLYHPTSTVNAYWSFTFMTRKAVKPTMTLNGTWSVSNCSQPSIVANTASLTTFTVQCNSDGLGNGYASWKPDSADDYISAEANP